MRTLLETFVVPNGFTSGRLVLGGGPKFQFQLFGGGLAVF